MYARRERRNTHLKSVIHRRVEQIDGCAAQVTTYVGSKHAVEGMAKCVALEFAKQNIRVNTVSPAAIDTDMIDRFAGKEGEIRDALIAKHPVGRLGKPEEIAAAVLYLCSDSAKFTTGTSLKVDGGWLAL
jgi:NAD(P)-dependent dehydrogenase (short-subunit alcohol dehydrogenase family)